MQLISYCVICARVRALLRGKLTPDSGTFVKCTYLEKRCMVYHSMYSMPDQTNIVHIFKCASPSPLVNTIPRQGQIYSKWVLVLTNLLHHLKGLCMMSITQSTLWNISVWLQCIVCSVHPPKCAQPCRWVLVLPTGPLLPRESSAFSTELRLRNVVMEINKSLRNVRRKSMVALCLSYRAFNFEEVARYNGACIRIV